MLHGEAEDATPARFCSEHPTSAHRTLNRRIFGPSMGRVLRELMVVSTLALCTGLSPISSCPGHLKAWVGSGPRLTGLPGTTVPTSPRTGGHGLYVIREGV